MENKGNDRRRNRPPQPHQDDSSRLGEWRLVGHDLGRGGQGEVRLVLHDRTLERGALKQMVGPRALTEKASERFFREIEAFRRVKHPFVLRILASNHQPPKSYLITEYAVFGSLHDNLSAFRGDVWRTLRLIRCIALGLSAAHELQIVHRDVKPKNILLHSLDHPLVGDFGIAHFADKDSLTSIDSQPGAFKFAPPEYEYDGEDPTPAFDVFSLGAVLHLALTGQDLKKPYRAFSTLPPVSSASERFGAIDELIAKMTHKEVAARFQRMLDVVDAIDNVVQRLFGYNTPLPENNTEPMDTEKMDISAASGIPFAADKLTLEELNQRYVRQILEEEGGNKKAAAARLGIDRRTLYRMLDKDDSPKSD